MIEIKEYTAAYKNDCLRLFESNMPLYFHPDEKKYFDSFLDNIFIPEKNFTYYVLLDNNIIKACGGYYFDIEKGEHVLCWGMVDNNAHKNKLGEKLLLYRIEKLKGLGATQIISNTAQHTWQFFAKYSFETVYTEKNHWGYGLDLYKMILKV